MSTALSLAGMAELDLLEGLHRAAFEEPWSAVAIGELLATPGSFALLANAAGTPAGFILCRAAGGECEILTLAVTAAARRRGIGRALVEAALTAARARGAGAMLLEVAYDNYAAQGLYARLGFEAIGRRAGYYRHANGARTDALLMRRPTPPGKRLKS